uniref:hypothetical protein n=1 Tax=Cohaesibacter celericrescens TaxID=2067669 RepID=UPI00356645E1
MKPILIPILFAVLSGCAHPVEPASSPSFNNISSYTAKIPGKYLILIDAEYLTGTIKPSDMNCAAHNYPLDLRSSFKQSTLQTLRNVFDELEEVTTAVDAKEMKKRNARGLVVVRGESFNSTLRVQPGYWTATLESRFSIVATVSVDKPKGRVFGSSFEGIHVDSADAGLFCSG